MLLGLSRDRNRDRDRRAKTETQTQTQTERGKETDEQFAQVDEDEKTFAENVCF